MSQNSDRSLVMSRDGCANGESGEGLMSRKLEPISLLFRLL